jgi:hypothetical protein
MKLSFRRVRIISSRGSNCRKLENGGGIIIGGLLILVCNFLPQVENGKFM